MANEVSLREICEKNGISSHAAKGPLFIHMSDGQVYISFDKKKAGYPQVNFVEKLGFWGGNWNKAEFVSPSDLYKTEVSEEIEPLSKLIKRNFHAFGEYFAQIPQEVHGNPKRGLYLNPVTLFTAGVNGDEAADTLKLKNPTRQQLHEAISQASDFKYSGLISLDELRRGDYSRTPEFSWGDEILLTKVLEKEFGFRPDIARTKGIIVEHLSDIPLNAPYASRWTIKYDRMNPLKKGDSADAAVFK